MVWNDDVVDENADEDGNADGGSDCGSRCSSLERTSQKVFDSSPFNTNDSQQHHQNRDHQHHQVGYHRHHKSDYYQRYQIGYDYRYHHNHHLLQSPPYLFHRNPAEQLQLSLSSSTRLPSALHSFRLSRLLLFFFFPLHLLVASIASVLPIGCLGVSFSGGGGLGVGGEPPPLPAALSPPPPPSSQLRALPPPSPRPQNGLSSPQATLLHSSSLFRHLLQLRQNPLLLFFFFFKTTATVQPQEEFLLP